MDHLINIPLDFMSPVCRLQNAAVFILVFMSACLHIGKALMIEILVNDAASLDYKERSSRRCIGEGCLIWILINFAAGAVWWLGQESGGMLLTDFRWKCQRWKRFSLKKCIGELSPQNISNYESLGDTFLTFSWLPHPCQWFSIKFFSLLRWLPHLGLWWGF